MSVLHLVRCERYEECKQEFSFGANMCASDLAPENWITLFEGNPRLTEGYNFCSKACLFNWLLDNGQQKPAPQPQDKPACKARRFLLVDENANIVEGVKWEDGHVTLDSSSQHCNGDFHCQGYFHDWDTFKQAHPGAGVQWIDQEVAE